MAHRRPLRRPLGVVLVAGLLLELPALQADPRRRRHRRARPQLSARPRRSSPTRAPSCASCWPSWSAARRKRGGALEAWHADIKKWKAEWDDVHAAQLRHPRHADPARARGGRLPGGAARRRHPGLRRRRQPQLVHAVLEGAPAADHAQLVGLLRHGLRRGGRARRQARGARPALRGDRRRRLLHRWCRTCCARRWSTTSRWCG